MIPFPCSEVYRYVLIEGWKIAELYRNPDFIRVVVYRHSQGMEDYMKLTGRSLGDCLNLVKHLEFSLDTESVNKL